MEMLDVSVGSASGDDSNCSFGVVLRFWMLISDAKGDQIVLAYSRTGLTMVLCGDKSFLVLTPGCGSESFDGSGVLFRCVFGVFDVLIEIKFWVECKP